jgi:subtilisin-like proprotein convertase family protein
MNINSLQQIRRLLFVAGFALCALPVAAQILPKDLANRSGLNFEFRESVSSQNTQGVSVLTGADYVYTSTPQRIDVNLKKLGQSQLWKPGDAVWEIPKIRGTPAITNPKAVNPVPWKTDPLLARQADEVARAAADPASTIFSFNALHSGSSPNDANGDVGTNWFVAAINGVGGSQYMFYDKENPANSDGPYTLDVLGSGPCAGGRGDPIIIYDELASRWIFTEFSFAGNRMCVYVSQTGDPINDGFFAYDFQAPAFPDYPKYALWGDAYYVGTNETTSALYALDRSAMLAGDPATMQRFSISDPAAFNFAMIPPVDLDGTDGPPADSPGIFIRHYDDEAHSPSSNVPEEDYLELFELDVDFITPANSSLTGPIRIAITDIDSELCGYISFSCFPQMDSTILLDPLREVVMNLPKYRNFGTHESIVGNLTTDVDGTDHGGVRWFELRRSGENPWVLHQEGTWAPDAHHRFMASSAMDQSGNIALAYSASSTSLYPSVRYTGRLETSPLGTMSQSETSLIEGAGPSNGNRWGDYASMSVDPVDGCSFWFVENYGPGGGPSRNNRVGVVRFEDCGEQTFAFSGSNLQQQVCSINESLDNVELAINGVTGFDNLVSLDFSSLPAGISGTFTPDSVEPDGSSVVDFLIDSESVTPGINDIIMRGLAEKEDLSGMITKEVTLSADIQTATPGPADLISPFDGATHQVFHPTFSWGAGVQWDESILEVATDNAFANIVYSVTLTNNSHSISASLEPTTAYFWRIRSSNACGEGQTSQTFIFTTAAAHETVCSGPELTIPDNEPAGISTDIDLSGTSQDILDLDISLDIRHTFVGDLDIRLEHVNSATSVLLFNRHCSGSDDILAILDDWAADPVSVCDANTPVISGIRIPDNALAIFNNLDTSSIWRLTVTDNAPNDEGVINEWCILHQSTPDNQNVFSDGFENP